MGQASSSSATGINSTGGNITKNSPSVLIIGICAVVVLALAWLVTRRKKKD